MRRLPDWQLRLEALMRERIDRPFAWGANDCALFAADCVEAITGVQLCPELRGHRDVRQALAALKRIGGVRALATRALGEPIVPALARPGDVVVIPAGKREHLAVCNGGTAVAVAPRGLTAISMRHARAAWRVG